jgi:hypothetical protein
MLRTVTAGGAATQKDPLMRVVARYYLIGPEKFYG